MKNKLKKSERQVERYYKQAKQELAEPSRCHLGQLNLIYHRQELIFRDAMSTKNPDLALKVINSQVLTIKEISQYESKSKITQENQTSTLADILDEIEKKP